MEVCLKHIQMRLKEIKIRSLTDCQGEKVFSRIIKTINYIFISQTKWTHTFVGFQRAGQDCRPSPNVPRHSLVGQVLNSGFQRSSRILDIPWIFVCETSLVWRKPFEREKNTSLWWDIARFHVLGQQEASCGYLPNWDWNQVCLKTPYFMWSWKQCHLIEMSLVHCLVPSLWARTMHEALSS